MQQSRIREFVACALLRYLWESSQNECERRVSDLPNFNLRSPPISQGGWASREAQRGGTTEPCARASVRKAPLPNGRGSVWQRGGCSRDCQWRKRGHPLEGPCQ